MVLWICLRHEVIHFEHGSSGPTLDQYGPDNLEFCTRPLRFYQHTLEGLATYTRGPTISFAFQRKVFKLLETNHVPSLHIVSLLRRSSIVAQAYMLRQSDRADRIQHGRNGTIRSNHHPFWPLSNFLGPPKCRTGRCMVVIRHGKFVSALLHVRVMYVRVYRITV
jgi:hypothetical protein